MSRRSDGIISQAGRVLPLATFFRMRPKHALLKHKAPEVPTAPGASFLGSEGGATTQSVIYGCR